MTYDTPPPDDRKARLHELVERFRTNINQYKNPNYNEEDTRADFIDPFFKLLGWDMDNTAGTGERYREVKREKSIIIDDKRKAPDYAFRVGELTKFFVEAKKPSVIIEHDLSSALQLRRYGYSRQLALSILTNFSEFAVYNTKIKLTDKDTAKTARIFYCRYNEHLGKCHFTNYETNFDYIDGIFSRKNVWGEKFDDYAESGAIKRGTSPVDKELLSAVEGWRLTLAKNIARRNPTFDVRQINIAVQKIIDRILFLRIAEGRHIERDEHLLQAINGTGTYSRLQELFIDADRKYNAGLFERQDWLESIVVDDKTIAPIIKGLYGERCPYAFEAIPIEILGSIYERFLGKTILLTAGHNAKVDYKPEVRKAGGVYYTPQYIVDYIVRETIGRKASPTKPMPTLTILDPACGSGSFLIGAYTYLLDAHLTYYTKDTATRKKSISNGKIYEAGENTYQLSIEEKQRILLNNIYGVDTDPLAVEVTKLSLYLKLMENETAESRDNLFRHSDMKMLPNLDGNVRCGNSLIESDFYNGSKSLFDDDEMLKINAFDWKKEFPTIFKAGGFDVVIGNPPYVFARNEKFTTDNKEYFYRKYALAQYQLNTYIMFVEQGVKLLKPTGWLGFIIPSNWMTINTTSRFREYILRNGKSITLVNNEDKVFQDSNVDTSILVFARAGEDRISLVRMKDEIFETVEQCEPDLFLNTSSIINFEAIVNKVGAGLLSKIEVDAVPLDTIALVKSGIKAYEVGKGVPPMSKSDKDARIYHSKRKLNKNYKKYLDGVDVGRYRIGWSGQYVQYGNNLAAPRRPELFQGERILVRQIPSKPPYSVNGSYVTGNCINDLNSMIVLKKENGYHIKYILAILNSRLISFWFNIKYGKLQRNLFPQFKVNELAQFPIRKVNFSDKKEKRIHDRLVELVDQMLSVQTNLLTSASELDRKRVSILDAQIDKAVYALYDLSEEEIKIVEGG